jgi:hypothetical protein
VKIIAANSYAYGALVAGVIAIGLVGCRPWMNQGNSNASEVAATAMPCPKTPAVVKDQDRGVWLFTWTRSDLAIRDPNRYISSAMTTSIESNQRWLDSSFESAPSESQGVGVYFAGDPLQSFGAYGRRLVVTKMKPFSTYPGGACALKGNPVVFSSDLRADYRHTVASSIPGLFYRFGMTNFVSDMALVLRGNEALQLIDADKTRVFDLDRPVNRGEEKSIWDKEVPAVAAEATAETLLEPFVSWIDLAMLAQTSDQGNWIAGGNVTARGLAAAVTADKLSKNATLEKNLKALQKGVHARQLENGVCGLDASQCLDFVHSVLAGQIEEVRIPMAVFSDIVATLGFVTAGSNGFASVQDVRAAFVKENAARVPAEKLRAALALIEAFRQKLTPDSMNTWKIPEDAFL